MDTITDILLKNNYTTSDEALNRGIYNVKVEDLHVYSDADWPSEAQEIIKNAGVTPQYRDHFPYGLQEVDTTEKIVLKPGETFPLDLIILTGKEKLYHMANVDIYTTCDFPEIVNVNGQTITAKQAGNAIITVYVKEANILITKTIEVQVENLS